MGNQSSHRKLGTSASLNLHDNNDFLSVNSIKVNSASERNFQNTIVNDLSEEKMIQELRDLNLANELRRNAAMKSSSANIALIPTVFRYKGKEKGHKIYISGSFVNWKTNIQMTKSDDVYFTIINCTPGHHSFKFYINGEWVHDDSQPMEYNEFNTINNYVNITKEDYDVDISLKHDEEHSKKSNSLERVTSHSENYGQIFPKRNDPFSEPRLNNIVPALLPPYINETVLNDEHSPHNDPSLLKSPYHVQLNHMYASSISSGVAALSITVRYRQKYITTIFYKTIS